MKKFTWREFALVLGPLLLLALPYLVEVDWLGLPFKRSRDEKYGVACRVNLKNVGMALRLYSEDFNDRFPPASVHGAVAPVRSPVGWVDALIPYSGHGIPTLMTCPASGIERSFSPSARNYTASWFNSSLSGVAVEQVTFPVRTLCIGDGNDGRDLSNATYSKNSLPASWITDTNSPAYRHLDGANYLMVDGSVHWLKPQEVTTFGGRKNAFAIK